MMGLLVLHMVTVPHLILKIFFYNKKYYMDAKKLLNDFFKLSVKKKLKEDMKLNLIKEMKVLKIFLLWN